VKSGIEEPARIVGSHDQQSHVEKKPDEGILKQEKRS